MEPYDPRRNTGTGFSFIDFNSHVMLKMIDSAIALYKDEKCWRQLMRRGMKKDFSWDASVDKYMDVYQELMDE